MANFLKGRNFFELKENNLMDSPDLWSAEFGSLLRIQNRIENRQNILKQRNTQSVCTTEYFVTRDKYVGRAKWPDK